MRFENDKRLMIEPYLVVDNYNGWKFLLDHIYLYGAGGDYVTETVMACASIHKDFVDTCYCDSELPTMESLNICNEIINDYTIEDVNNRLGYFLYYKLREELLRRNNDISKLPSKNSIGLFKISECSIIRKIVDDVIYHMEEESIEGNWFLANMLNEILETSILMKPKDIRDELQAIPKEINTLHIIDIVNDSVDKSKSNHNVLHIGTRDLALSIALNLVSLLGNRNRNSDWDKMLDDILNVVNKDGKNYSTKIVNIMSNVLTSVREVLNSKKNDSVVKMFNDHGIVF